MDAQSRKWQRYNQRTYRSKSHAVAEAEARKRRSMTLGELKARLLQEQERRRVG